MALFKCKMCGGDLQLTEGNPLATCEYCGTLQTVPSADNEKKMTLFARANRLRLGCEFDKAAGVYEALVADFPEEAEAYWGLVLCKYGIEYVDDPATGKKIPTCHRSSFESVMEDKDFEQVLENSDITARKVYREEAKQIEEIRKGIIAVSANEEPYDIFICYKETDAKGDRTLDSVLAQDVYDVLTDKGYRVFFSRITLEDKLGQEYEPYIFAALNSAKVMLAFGTDYEYFNAVWVKNEWSRYLKIMETDKSKHLIPCYKGIDAYDMPKEFAKLQAQDMGKVGAMQDLLRGIDKIIVPAVVIQETKETNHDTANLLNLGYEALKEGNWTTATKRFDLALLGNPTCADAYIGLLLAEKKIQCREELLKSKTALKKSNNFKETLNCADEALKKELIAVSLEWDRNFQKNARNNVIRSVMAVLICAVLVAAGAFLFTVGSVNTAWKQFQTGKISAQKARLIISENNYFGFYEDKLNTLAIAMCDVESISKEQPERFEMNEELLYACTSVRLENVKEVEILSGTSVIPNGSFFYWKALTAITIPDSVQEIGSSAFSGCEKLHTVKIPEKATRIGTYAFMGCKAIKTIIIPEGVLQMGNQVFANCENLETIYCEASEKPADWSNEWLGDCKATVVWGYTG